jgi:hypothetical protein
LFVTSRNCSAAGHGAMIFGGAGTGVGSAGSGGDANTAGARADKGGLSGGLDARDDVREDGARGSTADARRRRVSARWIAVEPASPPRDAVESRLCPLSDGVPDARFTRDGVRSSKDERTESGGVDGVWGGEAYVVREGVLGASARAGVGGSTMKLCSGSVELPSDGVAGMPNAASRMCEGRNESSTEDALKNGDEVR